MTDPLFWLGLSFLMVCVSLILLLLAALPALQAIAKAARSVEKLADTLAREFPPTLEAIRLTGMEISELTDDVTEGVQNAGQVVKQVDESIGTAKKQAKKAQIATSSIFTGIKAGWKTLTRKKSTGSAPSRRSLDRLPPTHRKPLELRELPTTRPKSYLLREENSEESSRTGSKVNRGEAAENYNPPTSHNYHNP